MLELFKSLLEKVPVELWIPLSAIIGSIFLAFQVITFVKVTSIKPNDKSGKAIEISSAGLKNLQGKIDELHNDFLLNKQGEIEEKEQIKKLSEGFREFHLLFKQHLEKNTEVLLKLLDVLNRHD